MIKRLKIFVIKIIRLLTHAYYKRKWNKTIVNQTKSPRLFFGPNPIINFSHWSKSIKAKGFDSKTVVFQPFSINKEDDFDVILNDKFLRNEYFSRKFKLIPGIFRRKLILYVKDYMYFDYVIENFDIYHISYKGIGILDPKYWNYEIEIIKKKGGKIIVLPYGSDWIMYSRYTNNLSFKHGLLAHYPNLMKTEHIIEAKFNFLNRKADVVLGAGNLATKVWDILSVNYITIDLEKFPKRENYDILKKGKPIKVVHSPNHRLIKGTDFLINAINELKKEGFSIELILIEGKKNDEVINILRNEADILVSQLLSGYALSAMEGMACSLPVIANMEDSEFDRRVLRRYSFLNECPILSGTPENIKDQLRYLIENPMVGKRLGILGRQYIEKYHSNNTANYLFNKIYDKIWYEKEVELMNLFNPLNPNSYNNQTDVIKTGLFENKIPESGYEII